MRSLVAAVALAGLAGCSTTPMSAENAAQVPTERLYAYQTKPDGPFGTIVVTRDSGLWGGGCYVVLSLGGKRVAEFGTKETASFYISPGETVAEISTNGICGGGLSKESEVLVKEGEARRYRIFVDAAGSYGFSRTSR